LPLDSIGAFYSLGVVYFKQIVMPIDVPLSVNVEDLHSTQNRRCSQMIPNVFAAPFRYSPTSCGTAAVDIFAALEVVREGRKDGSARTPDLAEFPGSPELPEATPAGAKSNLLFSIKMAQRTGGGWNFDGCTASKHSLLEFK
jgi:hypothetical protein